MATRPKFERFTIWMVAPEGKDAAYDAWLHLKSMFSQVADYFEIDDNESLTIPHKTSFAHALDILSKKLRLYPVRVLSNYHWLDLYAPIIARDRNRDHAVLLLPLSPTSYVLCNSIDNELVFTKDQIIDRFDELVQLYLVDQTKANAIRPRFLWPMGAGAVLLVSFLLAFLVSIFALFEASGVFNRALLLISSIVSCGLMAFTAAWASWPRLKNYGQRTVAQVFCLYHRILYQMGEVISVSQLAKTLGEMYLDCRRQLSRAFLLCVASVLVIAFFLWSLWVGGHAYLWVIALYCVALLLWVAVRKQRRYVRVALSSAEDHLCLLLDNYGHALNAISGLHAASPWQARFKRTVAHLMGALDKKFVLEYLEDLLYFFMPLVSLLLFAIWYSHSALTLLPWQMAVALVLLLLVGMALAYLSLRYELITVPIPSTSLSMTHVEPVNIAGRIDLLNVSFSYEDSGALIVKNMNLTIEVGKFYVLCGPSGAGKTTMLRLLMGDLCPLTGEVIIDGQDVRSLNQESLKKHFGVILEDAHLFAASVYDNIMCGRQLPKKQLKQLLLSHEIYDALIDLPMGLETFIFAQGKNISRTEYSLILMARALIHNPQFLFFDDILVGHSPAQQKLILDYLSDLGITRIITAHAIKANELAAEVITIPGLSQRN